MTSTPPYWVGLITDWHHVAAYFFAIFFPACRWMRRKYAGRKTATGSILHQVATGFLVPSLFMLALSFKYPQLVAQITTHELALAGLFALVTSLRELIIDGVDDDGTGSYSMFK